MRYTALHDRSHVDKILSTVGKETSLLVSSGGERNSYLKQTSSIVQNQKRIAALLHTLHSRHQSARGLVLTDASGARIESSCKRSLPSWATSGVVVATSGMRSADKPRASQSQGNNGADGVTGVVPAAASAAAAGRGIAAGRGGRRASVAQMTLVEGVERGIARSFAANQGYAGDNPG